MFSKTFAEKKNRGQMMIRINNVPYLTASKRFPISNRLPTDIYRRRAATMALPTVCLVYNVYNIIRIFCRRYTAVTCTYHTLGLKNQTLIAE